MPSEVSFEKDGDSPWGFQLTGGATFEMPLTVFEVQKGGRAAKAGIRLGDVLVKINGMETDKLTLEEAHDIIDSSGNNINLAVANLEDQEAEEHAKAAALALESGLEEEEEVEEEEEEEEEVRVDVASLPLLPPRPAPRPELAQKKCWHPVVLDTSPPPIIEASTGDEEAPHKKLMRNLRQAMDMKKIQNPSPEAPPVRRPPPPPQEEDGEIENKEPSMADQLRIMQRQLAALSSLPAVLQQSLTMVSQNLTRMLPPEPEEEAPHEQFEDEEEVIAHDSDIEYTEEDYTNEYVTEDEVSGRGGTPEPDQTEEEPESEPEQEPEPEPTLEELEKLDKLRKLKELNRAWPWGDNIKPVYKISDRYKVPHSEKFSNRIQTLEGKVILKKAPEVATQ